MAYIIAHGTMDGYEQYPKHSIYAERAKAIFDIREELDSGNGFLSKPIGYYITSDTDGVWISVVKLMRDGESDGNRPGFFAISAYIESTQIVSGKYLKDLLDDLMQYYLRTYTNGMRTCSIGVDWSFIEKAAIELNSKCTQRNRKIDTNYSISDRFAYVNAITDDDIIKFFDKPFQPEFGEYRTVFIGTSLQNQDRLTIQTSLEIDFDNEEYSIIWNGDTKRYPNLPQKIRKKDIDNGSYLFVKKYYRSDIVLFKDGIINNDNSTIELTIPELTAEQYIIEFDCQYPEAVVELCAQNEELINPRKGVDKNHIVFFGEQVELQWVITLKIVNGYKSQPITIYPKNYLNSVCKLDVVKLQTINIQILNEKGTNVTKNYNKLFVIHHMFNNIDANYIYDDNNLVLEIIEGEDFLTHYSFNIRTSDSHPFQIDDLKKRKEGLYYTTIHNIQSNKNPHEEQFKTIDILLPNRMSADDIKAVFNGIPIDMEYHEMDNSHYKYIIKIPKNNHRTDLSFYTKKDDKLLSVDYYDDDIIKLHHDDDTIKLYGEKTIDPILLIKRASIILGLLIIAAAIVIGGLVLLKIIPNPFKKNNSNNVTAAERIITDNSPKSYNEELDSILIAQNDIWDYEQISQWVGRYDSLIVKGKIKQSDAAYPLYKQLVWLQCRRSLNESDFEKLKNLINKEYPDSTKKEFLSEILNGNKQQLNNFRNAITSDTTFHKKTYKDIVNMYNKCAPSKTETPKPKETVVVKKDSINNRYEEN